MPRMCREPYLDRDPDLPSNEGPERYMHGRTRLVSLTTVDCILSPEAALLLKIVEPAVEPAKD